MSIIAVYICDKVNTKYFIFFILKAFFSYFFADVFDLITNTTF